MAKQAGCPTIMHAVVRVATVIERWINCGSSRGDYLSMTVAALDPHTVLAPTASGDNGLASHDTVNTPCYHTGLSLTGST